LIEIAPGEGSKSFASLERVTEALLKLNLERSDLIIAFGGGVTGDLTGFAAGITKRGIDFVQVPTTLLAQVDSSVGGKTAINASAGKNLVGVFWQPRYVLADLATLATLPDRDLRAGWAEILKIGLLGDRAFFGWCLTHAATALAGNVDHLAYAIGQSVQAKARIVTEDEREAGVRALLNLGHTFGHAFEAIVGFDERVLRHGEAVACGMAMAFRFSHAQGLCPQEDVILAERALSIARRRRGFSSGFGPPRPTALAINLPILAMTAPFFLSLAAGFLTAGFLGAGFLDIGKFSREWCIWRPGPHGTGEIPYRISRRPQVRAPNARNEDNGPRRCAGRRRTRRRREQG
jgi:3-dehydroquinate synthase